MKDDLTYGSPEWHLLKTMCVVALRQIKEDEAVVVGAFRSVHHHTERENKEALSIMQREFQEKRAVAFRAMRALDAMHPGGGS